MLNKILKAILDVVLYIPQDQRAVLAHVLQVSNACPELVYLGDPYRPEHKAWVVGDLQISYRFSNKAVHLGDVSYPLNWRARRILIRNFNNIFLMQHHQKAGKKIADIDAGNQEAPKGHPTSERDQHDPDEQVFGWGFEYTGEGMVQRAVRKPIPPMPETKSTRGVSEDTKPSWSQLAGLCGKKVRITRLDGRVREGTLGLLKRCGSFTIDRTYFADLPNIKEVVEITQKQESEWLTTFNLLDWDGKTIDVLRRDGIEIKNVPVKNRARLGEYAVTLEGELFTLRGQKFKHLETPEDVVAIKSSQF